MKNREAIMYLQESFIDMYITLKDLEDRVIDLENKKFGNSESVTIHTINQNFNNLKRLRCQEKENENS